MTTKILAETDNCKVTYNDEDIKPAVDMLLAWYKKHESFDGETIQQCDEPSIDSVNIMSEIADKLFNVEWNDE